MDIQQFLNDDLLQRRIKTFYGYGNYEGKYWFIGMEEAGGETFENINRRIDTWVKRGEQEIEDVKEYHEDMGVSVKGNQNTWNKLIRILLSAKRVENIDIKDVKEYQSSQLGRKEKETCLLELLPLPSKSVKDWIYSKYSQLHCLSDRKTYRNDCSETRINHIIQMIEKYKPKAVIFYGVSYREYWQKVANIEFKKIESSKKHYFFIGKNHQTIFVIAIHPVARGVTNQYFHDIGKSISVQLGE